MYVVKTLIGYFRSFSDFLKRRTVNTLSLNLSDLVCLWSVKEYVCVQSVSNA